MKKSNSIGGFKNWSTPIDRQFEQNTNISNTVPDRSLSIRQLIDRHNSGNGIRTYTGVYDSPLPAGVEKLSQVDRAQLALDTADFVRTQRGKLLTIREAKRKEAERVEAEQRAADKAKLIAERLSAGGKSDSVPLDKQGSSK